ncbi:hypothetical protein AB4122_07530 [Vibrio cyclitrophicus]|uniref:hypothetical protein n=1 Tax=Vibrio cyclitrophicus TaxID=47951 RepID=UPI0002F5E34F|nr:hypothetical protein [Vibrio cyclitrophicus]KNH13685.1 hypothetical protein ACS79_06785 [Vibrio lentus]OED76260.1 hypothetical protein OAS_00790 [Vibrio cyclitrophicus ZF65]PMG13852.1 hypothetical protein BCU99_12025 [Vibrio cyclitrophicus]
MTKISKIIAFSKDKRVLIVIALLALAVALFFEAQSIHNESFYKDFVVGSLFPEIIGVVAELLFVYLIFSYIDHNRHQQHILENERRSRSYLRFFIVDLLRNEQILNRCVELNDDFQVFKGDPEQFKFYDFQSEFNGKVINTLSIVVQECETESVCNHIRSHVKIDLGAFQAMLPVVSKVSAPHFKLWQRTLYFMSMIASGENTIGNTKKVLARIRLFDKITARQFVIKQRT